MSVIKKKEGKFNKDTDKDNLIKFTGRENQSKETRIKNKHCNRQLEDQWVS